MPESVDDHTAIADAVKNNDAEKAVSASMTHWARLDDTIAHIWETNANYFEPV